MITVLVTVLIFSLILGIPAFASASIDDVMAAIADLKKEAKSGKGGASVAGFKLNVKSAEDFADQVNRAKKERKKICAVGTTAVRALESSVSVEGLLKPFDGWTNKFIFPPYEFSIPAAMNTNFHTPKSTLLRMVSAFGGYELIMEAYKQAGKEKYRFYSYGDAMLII